ncbi:MFS transporter [Silvimonas iriomotensis]|uniref:MFS transporter n=1 Tax=Silvimonas iriomotensis TaxID=449662 RepID=A0ABQ2PCL6_9NEIS|nr:MFS transporter [Silvimonas iriomotensis]GGP22966.1 MFS transporter [Silvimonas iriomotensis]
MSTHLDIHHLPANHRWKILGLGFAANAAFSATFAGIPATSVLLRADYHLDTHQLGLVLGMMGLGVAVSELPWGMLTDRWGDRRVLLLGLFSIAAWLLFMMLRVSPAPGYVPTMAALMPGLLLVGLLGGSVNGSSGRAIMAWFTDKERGLAMSIRQTAVPFGGALGALVLPPLARWGGFGMVYGALALFCLLNGVLAWRWLHEPPHHEATTKRTGTTANVPPLQDPVLLRMTLGIGLLCVPQVAVLTFTPVFLHDFGHFGTLVASVALITVQLGGGALRVWSGYWTDRHHNRQRYIAACASISVLLFALLALLVLAQMLVAPLASVLRLAVVVALVAAGLGVSAWHGVAYTELATQAGAQRAGTALGMGNAAVFVAFFITPMVIPVLNGFSGWPAVWLMGSLGALLALFAFRQGNAAVVRNAALQVQRRGAR